MFQLLEIDRFVAGVLLVLAGAHYHADGNAIMMVPYIVGGAYLILTCYHHYDPPGV